MNLGELKFQLWFMGVHLAAALIVASYMSSHLAAAAYHGRKALRELHW